MADTPASRLGALSGLLFDRAATLWYRALGLEVLSSVLAAIVAFTAVTGDLALYGTLGVVALLALAYGARLYAEDVHETAQTIRRQAALSDGLGWKIEPIQLQEWRRKAGVKLLKRIADEPRSDDYYATDESTGPRRMAEMTRESAFYTRHLDLTMRGWLTVALGVVAIVVIILMYLVLATPRAAALGSLVAQVVTTVVLIAIGLDAVGWWLRLSRQASAIREIERGLDRLLAKPESEEADVLRLVAEYDCELANSIPIHSWVFNRRHDEIQELWNERTAGTETAD
jgi:uncharacterized membrane protein YqjE